MNRFEFSLYFTLLVGLFVLVSYILTGAVCSIELKDGWDAR